jgi:hypothetical protein
MREWDGRFSMGKVKKKVVKEEGKTQAKTANNDARKVKKKPFSGVEVYSKPGLMQPLFAGFREGEVACDIVRPRMLTESVEHGRGRGIIRNFTFRKFKDQPKAVFFMSWPTGVAGGSFEPTDRLLKPGEPITLSYAVEVDGADKPIYFVGKAYFLRKSYYVADNPANPGKPWTGPRAEAKEKLTKDVFVRGEDIIEIRVDNVTSMPNGPGGLPRDILERYLSKAKLYVIPGGGGWSQRSTQGNFFKNIREPVDKYLEKDGVKLIEKVTLDEFSNMGNVTMMVQGMLLSGLEHDKIREVMIKKPNDYLREINATAGFLLHFQMTDEIKDIVIRTVPDKAGKENDVFLPLMLESVADSVEQYRVTFRVFPRDLVENRSRNSVDRGLHFKPPNTLHPGSENQLIFSKLVIALRQLFREDEKPDEEKLKSEKLQASVQARISEQSEKFTDKKLKSAFQKRVEAKKREDD